MVAEILRFVSFNCGRLVLPLNITYLDIAKYLKDKFSKYNY